MTPRKQTQRGSSPVPPSPAPAPAPAAKATPAPVVPISMNPSGDINLYMIAAICLLPITYQIQRLSTEHQHVIACVFTVMLIPQIAPMTAKAGLSGIDINKPKNEIRVPESLGIVPGVVYLCAIILFQLRYQFSLVEYNAALTSLVFMLFLGFADDVLDIRWRYKIILPVIATLPLLVSYSGSTEVVVPPFMRQYLPTSYYSTTSAGEATNLIDLGPLYMVYMALLSVFCSNSINILAGINGLEAGQSLIISASILYFNLSNVENSHSPFADAHLFSVFLVFPFFFVTFGLLYFNWFPSRVFVGDTYTLFAGMIFAVAGILGHFSETLLLLFLPQIINFVYSLPQLIGIIPCPRHRLPKFNDQTGLLEGKPTNLNLVNLTLLVLGPMSEKRLCVVLLAFQMICAVFGLWLRQSYIIPLFRG